MAKKKSFPKTPEEMQKHVQKLARQGKIVLAPHDGVDALEDECYEFIERVFGVKRALLTDLSTVSDMPETPDWKHLTSRLFGIPLPEKDNPTILEVAREIRRWRQQGNA